MSNLRAHTAIELKDSIERIIKHDRPIGECLSIKYKTQIENEEDIELNDSDYEEEDNTHDPTLSTFKKVDNAFHRLSINNSVATGNLPYSQIYKVLIDEFPHSPPDSINIRNFSGGLIEMLWNMASPSGFGDNKTLETKFDEEVRNSREIKKFTVSENLTKELASQWKNHRLCPENVRVIPYKINIYRQDGHFDEHRDTPEAGLIGTMLVSIFDSTDQVCFRCGEKEWQPFYNGDWIAFYTDIPHKVLSIKKGYRCTIAFKVYSENLADSMYKEREISDENNVKIINDILGGWKRPFGILLSHKYTVKCKPEKGSDGKFVEIIQSLPGTKSIIIPVVTNYTASWSADDEQEDAGRAHVFSITDDAIDKILGFSNQKQDIGQDETNKLMKSLHKYTRFFQLNKGYVWKEDRQNAIEFTGNESCPGREDSIYCNTAIIIFADDDDDA